MALPFIYLLPILLFAILIPETCTSLISDDENKGYGRVLKQDLERTLENSEESVNTKTDIIKENSKKHVQKYNNKRRHGSGRFEEKRGKESPKFDNADETRDEGQATAKVAQTDESADINVKGKDTSEKMNIDEPQESDTDQEHVEVTKENENANKEVVTVCPKCGKKEQQKDLRIEMVKQQLLKKIGLPSVPKVDGPIHPLPFDFYVGEDFAVNDGAEEPEDTNLNTVRTRQVFIMGTDITNKCAQKKSTGCYSFNITGKNINPDEVASIELWVYKQADLNDHHIQTFMVSELAKTYRGGKSVLRSRNIVKRVETRLKYGWMKIYVMRAVLRWLSKPHRNNGLAVVCKTCQRTKHRTIYGDKEGLTPILVFYMNKNRQSRRRVRRETNCIEGGSNCCHREPLEINFRDIGWDYIMAPTSIRPNYCTGSCNGIQAAYYNHTRVVQTLQQSVMHNYGTIQPCCSPVAFRRPQSLLYRDHEGTIRKVDVPDLIVGECGCT